MKFYFRIFVVLIVLFLVGNGCWGRKTYTYFFTWTGIDTEKVLVSPSGKYFVYDKTDNSSFLPGTFGMLVYFKGELLKDETSASGFGLITPACATSVPKDDYVVLDSVSHIRIAASADFDEEHPAGSDISKYFNSIRAGKLYPADEMIDYVINCTRYSKNSLGESYFLSLRESPALGGVYRFEITVILKSGRELTCSTGGISLLKP